MSYEDHHTEAIKTSTGRIIEIDKQLLSAKGKTKRELKRQKNAHEKTIRKNRKDHDQHLEKENKLEFKEEKYEDKQQTLAVAYQNGIDPRANFTNAIGNVIGQAGSAVGNFMGMGGVAGFKGNPSNVPNPRSGGLSGVLPSDRSNLLIIVVVAILVFFGFKRR